MNTVDQAAGLLLSLRRGQLAKPRALPADIAPQSEAAAYAIQLTVLRLLGEDIGGWKASMPDASSGFSAPIAARAVLASPAGALPADIATLEPGRVGIEPEIAFRMARDLSPRTDGAQHTRAAVVDAIASAHAAIEICVCRLADFDRAAPLDRLADGIMNEGLVVGPACTSWRALTLSQLPLRVDVGGATVHQGIGGHPIGDPLIPLVWMANHLAARGIALRAGAMVTTGSCNGIRYIERGQQVQVGFAGLGQANFCW
jgi:2-keto-4-pentenoate hydratase